MSQDTPKKNWKKIKEEGEFSQEEAVHSTDEPSEHTAQTDVDSLEDLPYEELKEKLLLAEKQAHENWEKSVRALAELDNVRRRAERDIANAHRYGLDKFVDSLIPVIDSLEQATTLAEQATDKSMQEGLELTTKLLLDALQKHGVEQLNPTEGTPFDPQQHEAMAVQPATEMPPNTVLNVFQKGYRLNERVIRPARVIVTART